LGSYHLGLGGFDRIRGPKVSKRLLVRIVDNVSGSGIVVARLTDGPWVHQVSVLWADGKVTFAGSTVDFGVEQAGSSILKTHEPSLDVCVSKESHWVAGKGKIFEGIFHVDQILIFI
jgi:hypothetical protein